MLLTVGLRVKKNNNFQSQILKKKKINKKEEERRKTLKSEKIKEVKKYCERNRNNCTW